MEFHPIASLFPMMSVEEFKALKKSIQERGQHMPIYTYEGKIVDGRNRYQACIELGLKPRFEEWDGKGLLVDFVWDLNAERRQLTGGALHIAAGRYAIEREAEAKRRGASKLHQVKSQSIENKSVLPPPIGGGKTGRSSRSAQIAANKFGVGARTVERAVKIVKKGSPELIHAVETGQTSVWTASQVATLPVEKQKEIVTSKPNGVTKTIPQKPKEKEHNKEIKLQGVGVIRAHEAINYLKRIPKDDPLRKRGFQIVTDWIRHNQ